ncbi:MAG: hypothetical protein HGA76_01230 [Candidatus Firestonebacteria bacterium]|nr:hypothetical protein [Candidatus Firestonebacteria bacterium]
MQKPGEDSRWQEAFKQLPDHQPRPGYAQRFWARADSVPALPRVWKWLPWGAVLAGLLVGLGLGQYRLNTPTPTGPSLNQLLAEGSLAGQFAALKTEE